MTPRPRVGLVLVVALAAGCGLFPKRGKPKRVATPKAKRVGPEKKGLDLAADPLPTPTVAQILESGLLVGISDGVASVLDDEGAKEGEVAWLTASLERGGDDERARTLLKIRRAAFGVHIPRAGERHEVEDDVLEDRGLGIDASAVALIGPDGPCLARRGKPVVTALETGGHRLDIRWPLEGCGPGPWAPIGIVAQRIPTTLRWTPPTCEETDDARDAWSVIADDSITRLGVLRDGTALVGLVGQAHDGNWLWIADQWQARGFTLAGKPAIGCPTAPAAIESDVGESSGP
jgi:hypothetical protein